MTKNNDEIQLRVRVSGDRGAALAAAWQEYCRNNDIKVSFNAFLDHILVLGLRQDGFVAE